MVLSFRSVAYRRFRRNICEMGCRTVVPGLGRRPFTCLHNEVICSGSKRKTWNLDQVALYRSKRKLDCRWVNENKEKPRLVIFLSFLLSPRLSFPIPIV